MTTNRRTAAAHAVAGVLAFDGLLHVFWATGSHWPAADPQALSYAVLGRDAPFTPPVVLPLAALLFTAAALVAARARLGRGHRFWRAAQLGTVAVACGLAVRGLAGLAWAAGVDAGPDEGTGSTFHWLNLALYTPLCLVLAACALTVARERSE
ncbi:DUF3995 domain-containing protein [Streptomyces sp. NPDC015127]|uniref:DUF3995 domain-containing protein n=1 Tax=Streptomyces sp. NPDC015127 TaxID=3364939 RepID=UPI003701D0F6